ncbi:MAG: hypothetical protein C0434_04345 [Xanthomonadaceae bacterium]|nr:hypothetical protein [Xanthomonadaceae bacterium]
MPERRRQRPRPRRRIAGVALLLGLIVPLLADAQARPAPQTRKAPVQCWTDDRGQRVCGDVVPPSEARRARELIDRRGIVTGVVPAQKSQAQIEAEAKRARDEEQRLAYDRYLLQAYGDVPAIERARDDRLAALDAQRQLTEKAIADTRATLADLRGRLPKPPAPLPAGAPAAVVADARLQARIDEFVAAEADQQKALARLGEERTRIRDDFARDIARYRALKRGNGG